MKLRHYQALGQRRQQGMVLIVAIIAMVAMTIAVAAMLRSTTGSQNIVGNLAFKKNATAAGDLGVEQARTWLMAQTTVFLSSDHAAQGYFSRIDPAFDPLAYNWTAGGNAKEGIADDGSGNRVLYVIHRLCTLAGSPSLPAQSCVRPSSLNQFGAGTSLGSGGGGAPPTVSVIASPYFRITTRIEGPRNTLSYVQVIMY
jgi:type IV pilus assembly protein PilX